MSCDTTDVVFSVRETSPATTDNLIPVPPSRMLRRSTTPKMQGALLIDFRIEKPLLSDTIRFDLSTTRCLRRVHRPTVSTAANLGGFAAETGESLRH